MRRQARESDPPDSFTGPDAMTADSRGGRQNPRQRAVDTASTTMTMCRLTRIGLHGAGLRRRRAKS
jgi:hypothetical protein